MQLITVRMRPNVDVALIAPLLSGYNRIEIWSFL